MDRVTPAVNIAVCGTFHYPHYIRHLQQRGCLNHFYYAAKRATTAAAIGIAEEKSTNAWLKEYLVHGHMRALGHFGTFLAFPFYNRIWESAVLRTWKPCDLFHLMIHGTGERLLDRARREKILSLGEPVNSSPAFSEPLIREEHDRLGISAEVLVPGADRIPREVSQCDFLLSGSEFIRRSYVATGFPAEKTFVLPYAANLSRFRPPTDDEKKQRDGKFRVICVGQIVPRKGHVYLLEAWKRCAFPDAELLIIGSIHPTMRPVMEKYAGVFRHIERVPNNELFRHYGQSSVFVLMAVEDGFGYVCTEALACGLPVILTENTGANSVIREGENGFILPIRDVDGLCQRLQLLYASPETRTRMSAEAVTSMHGTTSWDAYAEKLCDLYRELTKSRK